HLFFGKPALLHDFLFSVGSHSLKFQLVRKFQGRSDIGDERAIAMYGLIGANEINSRTYLACAVDHITD
ncbi:hypothetical protein, partial [Burkholderia pseudomallei]